MPDDSTVTVPPPSPDLVLRGYSDDLIEVEGAITEEWGATDEPAIVAFSDGTAARIEFDSDGVWRVSTLRVGPGSAVAHLPGVVGDDENYSDVLSITAAPGAPITWAVLGTDIAYSTGSAR